MTVKHYSLGMLILLLSVYMIGTNPVENKGEVQYSMSQKLDRFIDNEPDLKGAIIGMSIRDGTTGEKVYEHMGDTRLHPASNMKLLTAASALKTLGPDYTFSTEILTEGEVYANTLEGNLILKGHGDPTLLPADFNAFAKKIKNKGITKIEGDIIGDDTWYNDVRLSPDLTWSDEDWYYGAQISALTAAPDRDYDAGTITVEVRPDDVGEEPGVTVKPGTNYVQVTNNATTTDGGTKDDLTLRRLHGENTIVIEGDIPAESPPVKEWMAVWEPTGYAMALFSQALENHGITWSGNVKTKEASADADVFFTHKSMPLSEMLMPLMKLSNNTLAEVLVKEMGKVVHDEGSWEKGLEVVEAKMDNFGMTADASVVRDGSGISHVNLLTPNDLSKLLHAVKEEEWFDVYLKSLPIAGDSDRMTGGTLRHRMNDQTVQAKTGTIYSVSTLSGYAETETGRKLTFSIMLNNLLDEEDGLEIENNLIEIMTSH